MYRHIRKLADAGCICVVEEKQVRGTTERTYALVQNPFGKDPDMQDMAALIYAALLSLQTSFLQYFEKEHTDPQKDMLFLNTSTLMLNDEEYIELMNRFSEAIMPHINNQPGEGRKPRRFTMISSPMEE